MTEEDVEKNLSLINQIFIKYYGLDISGYKKNFIIRRLQIAARKTGIKNVDEFILTLKQKKHLGGKILNHLTISVSSFFRNPDVFKYMETHLIPLYRGKDFINVLSCGCAAGEEAYSIGAILMKHFHGTSTRFHVTGIDISAESIRAAKEAVYPNEKFHEIPSNFRKFFHVTSRGLEPVEELKNFVSFLCANIINFTPDEKYDIILLRNILIFMERNLQKKVLEKVLELAKPGAALILGKVESIHAHLTEFFKPFSLARRIYIIQKFKGGES